MTEKQKTSGRSRAIRNAIVLGVFAIVIYAGYIWLVSRQGQGGM